MKVSDRYKGKFYGISVSYQFRTGVTNAFLIQFDAVSDLKLDVSREEATAELNAVLASPLFARSPRMSRLLSYLCTKFLDGEADQIKEYSIGVEVLQRPPSFDPATDAGARVEVHRLRRRLQQFYESEGAGRKLRIVIPLGHYVPTFIPNVPLIQLNPAAESACPAPEDQAPTPAPADVGFDVVADIAPPARRPFPRGFAIAGGMLLLAIAAGAMFLARRPARTAPAVPGIAAGAPTAAVTIRPVVIASLPAGNSVRIACGRTMPYTDRGGQVWAADRYFEGGTPFDSPRQFLPRAFDPKLFQSGRSGDFSYQIPLPRGVYELHLGFVETTFGPGTASGGGEYSRTFDVKANGRMLLDDFDIFSDANGTNVADTRAFKDISPAPDGFLHLEFHSRRGPALVNTIELVPALPHRLNPIRLVAQENFITLSNGAVWSPDTYVNGGQPATHNVPLTGTADPDLYARERYGHFDYAIPVDAGTYSLSLYFAEEYFGPGNPGGGGVGSRIFDVFCNGAALLRNFDILKTAGGMNRALVKTFHGLTPNAQGKLEVSFVPVHNYASLYAVEVLDESQ